MSSPSRAMRARKAASTATGLVAWIVVVTLLNFGLRRWLPGYQAVEHAMTSLVAGAVVRAIAPASRAAPWIMGLIGLVMFVPDHISIWAKFPIWYHLTFLLTLVVLSARLKASVKPVPA
jgi:hypothetical protein